MHLNISYSSFSHFCSSILLPSILYLLSFFRRQVYFFNSSFDSDLLHSFSLSVVSLTLFLPQLVRLFPTQCSIVWVMAPQCCIVVSVGLGYVWSVLQPCGSKVSQWIREGQGECVCACKLGSEKAHASTRGDCNNTPGTPQDNTHTAFTPLSPLCLSVQ